MSTHYPFHTSVLSNFYGCDPYNTVDAQRLRRHVRTVAGFLVTQPPVMQAGPDKYALHTWRTCPAKWTQSRYAK